MVFKRFTVFLLLRLLFVLATLTILVWLLYLPGYPVTSFLFLLAFGAQIVGLVRHVQRTNRELARFLEALKFSDYSQKFDGKGMGDGFEQLGHAMTEVMQDFEKEKRLQEKNLRYVRTLIEHIPTPLISLQPGGRLTVWNNAARRLLGPVQAVKLEDLNLYGRDFFEQVKRISPQEGRLVTLIHDGVEQRFFLSCSEIVSGGQQEKLISLQDIGNELEVTQLQAWQDLVRVLTHEIMNSITPVTSLATTAVTLLEEARHQAAESAGGGNRLTALCANLDDAHDAVSRVARRSDALMQFVSAYRQLARLPKPAKQALSVRKILEDAAHLFQADWAKKAISLTVEVRPDTLEVAGDASMINQVIINLLQNGERAVRSAPQKEIFISAYIDRRSRVRVDVRDTGAGIPDDIISEIFVPFFTTQTDGSGIGLALSRQIMVAHSGTIKATNHKGGGAVISLIF